MVTWIGCELPSSIAGPAEPGPPPTTEPDPPPVEPTAQDPLFGLASAERAERLRELGAAAYAADGDAKCAVCHGVDGQGIRGAIPPLRADRPWSQDCAALASIVLFGAHEIITRDGLTYVAVMPPLGDQLDDLQVAAVSTYVNGRWGTGPACDPLDVAMVRFQGPVTQIE